MARASSPQGDAAALGSAVHAAIDTGVKLIMQGHTISKTILSEIFDQIAPAFGVTPERITDGHEMIGKWQDRQDWSGRKIISSEEKQSLDLKVPTASGPVVIPFNFVLDRLDRLDQPDGSYDLEIVDYKTGVFPMNVTELSETLQARCYSMAVRWMYPDVRRIWVTFDMLRHNPVSISLKREDDVRTYLYIQSVAAKILEDNEPEERLNVWCRYCVRKSVCKSLTKHVDAAGTLGITDHVEAAHKSEEIQHAIKALSQLASEMDGIVVDWCKLHEVTEFEDDSIRVMISTGGRRSVTDPNKALEVIGPDLAQEYGKIGVTEIDKIKKSGKLPADKETELDALVVFDHGAPSVKFKSKGALA